MKQYQSELEKIKIMKKKRVMARSKMSRKAKTRKKTSKVKRVSKARPSSGIKRVVRIMGQGQFYIDKITLKKLSAIDDMLVELVEGEKADDGKFRNMLVQLNTVAARKGKPVERGEIVKSDIILPSSELPIDEAKKLFRGEGVIPN